MFPQTPRNQTNMTHDFSKIPAANVPRSVFKRPYECHTAHDAGDLIPFYVEEVLPADTHKFEGTIFSRLTTPLVPFMSNLYLDSFFFFVPFRLLQTNFVKMMGEQDNPADSIAYATPKMYIPATTGFAAESLQDYLNYAEPTVAGDGTATYQVHNYAGRAYNLIWNEFFRDENLQNSVTVDLDDGPDDPADYVVLKRGKRHDYFTSCLPWPQKGTAVTIGLSGTAPINRVSNAGFWEVYKTGTDSYPSGIVDLWSDTSGNLDDAAAQKYSLDPKGGIVTDLSSATGISINDFRLSLATQMLLEADARGGTRYTELLQAHYGVVNPDARQQRPEYLGGGRTNLQMTTVPQTSETNTTSQGTLAAFAQFAGGRHNFNKSFVEHGVIIGMLSVRSDYSYQRGIPKFYSRDTKYDFYWPAFAHLGEQAVLNKEIYVQGLAGGAADEGVFGYQEYGAELRYARNQITGKMRSFPASGSLDIWHTAQDFTGSPPTLGATFIQETPPISRVTEVSTEPEFRTDVYADITSVRPMPIYSTPGLLTRL